MYFHTRKHHFVRHSSPCGCVEGCIVYVPAWKCQFVHFQRPGASTVDRVRYLYTRKRFAMIRVHAQEALQGISLLGIASLQKTGVHAHAQGIVQHMMMLGNTILCTTNVTVAVQKAFCPCKHQFVRDQGPCACVESCVLYVPAWKCQFMHFRGPGACTVDRVRYLYTTKQQFRLCHAPCTCARDTARYLLARNRQFVEDWGSCRCIEVYIW